MGKVTNQQLAKIDKPRYNKRTLIEIMGIEEEFWKLRAEGKSLVKIAEIFNKKHPKEDGSTWKAFSLQKSATSMNRRSKQRMNLIASTDTSVADAVAKETINTTKRLQQLDKMLDSWLKKINTQGKSTHVCESCGEKNVIDTFDPDKAVRVADQMRRLLMTTKQVASSLPDVPNAANSSGNSLSSLNIRKFIDKLVDDGALIVADEEKLKEYGV